METNTNKVVLKEQFKPNTDDVVPRRTVATVQEGFVLKRTVNEADGEDFVLKRTVETQQKTSRRKKTLSKRTGLRREKKICGAELGKNGVYMNLPH